MAGVTSEVIRGSDRALRSDGELLDATGSGGFGVVGRLDEGPYRPTHSSRILHGDLAFRQSLIQRESRVSRKIRLNSNL